MKKSKGSILVFALIVLSFILIAAFSVAAVTLVERRSANVSVNSSTAFQNSDKGMEEFLQQIYKDLDQNDTLDDLAEALNDVYSTTDYQCREDVSGARIGSDGSNSEEKTDFIITAFRELTPGEHDSGWDQDELVQMTDCTGNGSQLADVARFKVTGNYNNAARAVFVKLRDSLTRGLVAHWSFEDRAQVETVALQGTVVNSYVAQDSSKQNHILTLCPIDSDDSVEVVVDYEESTNLDIEEFGPCEGVAEGGGMDPYKNDDGGTYSGDEYSSRGAWVDGIVEMQSDGGVDTEGLYFDGVSYFLSTNIDNSCVSDATFNCIKEEKDLLASIKDGITVSLWVNVDSVDNDGNYLISRYDDSGDDGFEMYFDGNNPCFRVNDTASCASNSGSINDDKWHHVVGRWMDSDTTGDIEIFVDGFEYTVGSPSVNAIDIPGNNLIIGASDRDADDAIDSGSYYDGYMDDVQIWDRALTDNEICRVCTDAFDQDNPPSDAPTCNCTLN